MFKRIASLLGAISVALLSTAGLAGCNTVEGVGKDISHLGGAIQHESREGP